MIKKFKASLLTALLYIFPIQLMADVSTRMIAFNCQSCHNHNLQNLDLSQPLSTDELTKTLLAFKYGNQSATVMDRITKGFSDQELKSVASYFSQKR